MRDQQWQGFLMVEGVNNGKAIITWKLAFLGPTWQVQVQVPKTQSQPCRVPKHRDQATDTI